MIVHAERLKAQNEEHLLDEEIGFNKDRSTTLRFIVEKAR